MGAFEPFSFWTFTYAGQYAALYGFSEGIAILGCRLRASETQIFGLALGSRARSGVSHWPGTPRRRPAQR